MIQRATVSANCIIMYCTSGKSVSVEPLGSSQMGLRSLPIQCIRLFLHVPGQSSIDTSVAGV